MHGRGRGRGPGPGGGRGRQRHRGRVAHLLEPAVLIILHRGAAHGYGLAEQLTAFNLDDVSLRRIYRLLQAMEENGWVVSDWETEETQGPPRRIYALTPQGEELLEGWIAYLRESREGINRLISAYERRQQ